METLKEEADKVAFLGFDQREVSTPVTDHAVRLQLDLVLQSSLFFQSKRLSRFLRFVVERSLEGHAEELKERTIAAQVFDRVLAYDSASDPIVRVAAGDLRKRLAQYYVQEAHTAELRIELPQGSYRPLFTWPSSPAVRPRTYRRPRRSAPCPKPIRPRSLRQQPMRPGPSDPPLTSW